MEELQPDRKSGTLFCDFTNRCRKDGKNHTTVTDLNLINFVDLFYSFIFQQLLIKISQLFPNYMANYQNPYFMYLLRQMRSFFGRESCIKLLFLYNLKKL